MRPLIEIARFFRPSFASQKTNLSAFALNYFSSSAKCTNTADDSRSSAKPEVLESQDISAAKVEANSEQRTPYTRRSNSPWNEDDYRKLKDAHEKCMSTKAIAALFPMKTLASVAAQRRMIAYSSPRTDARLSNGRKYLRWSPDEIELLGKLHKDGASRFRVCAHFPTRSPKAVSAALQKYVLQPASPSARRRPWSQEDTQYLTESALQGVGAHEIAKNLDRTPKAVWTKARSNGVRFLSTVGKFTTKDSEKLQQMRADGATFKTIAATLGIEHTTVIERWHRLNPDYHYYRSKRTKRHDYYPPTRLLLDDYQRIRSLRDQAASWSSIGCLFPQYQLDSIKQDFWRFTNRELSPTDISTIQSLRQEGRSWQDIVGTGDYPIATGNGMKKACDRMLRNE
jgi:hypothetical protein